MAPAWRDGAGWRRQALGPANLAKAKAPRIRLHRRWRPDHIGGPFFYLESTSSGNQPDFLLFHWHCNYATRFLCCWAAAQVAIIQKKNQWVEWITLSYPPKSTRFGAERFLECMLVRRTDFSMDSVPNIGQLLGRKLFEDIRRQWNQ